MLVQRCVRFCNGHGTRIRIRLLASTIHSTSALQPPHSIHRTPIPHNTLMNTKTYAFDAETSATKVDDNHWQLELAPDWNIGNNPNGGYILACLLRSMATLTPDTPDPISVTTHYLRPGLPGQTAELKASIVRLGRRTATITGTMEQDGKPRITCTATFGNIGDQSTDKPGLSKRDISLPALDIAPPEECTTRSELAQAVDLPIMNRLDIRVDPRYAHSDQQKEAIMAGWIRFNDDRAADSLALMLFCDAFPPSVFTLYGPIGWVPTIELSVHVRRRPQPGWIKGVFKTSDLTGDLFIEDGTLWDENDNLLACSRQLQLILN